MKVRKHRRDLFPDILPVLYKHGIDQRIRRNTGFPHHAAKQCAVSQPAWTIDQIHMDTFLLNCAASACTSASASSRLPCTLPDLGVPSMPEKP